MNQYKLSNCSLAPPILLLGMHRSGTTMLVDYLEKSGLFLGAKYGVNKEAFFFMERAEWYMRRAGGAWDEPAPIQQALEDDVFLRRVASDFQRDLSSKRFKGFYSHSVFNSSKVKLVNGVWGWKDPRAIFFIKVWRTLFPDFKAVIITRNGVDVAQSLRVRAIMNQHGGAGDVLSSYSWVARIKNLLRKKERYILGSARSVDLKFGYRLWEQYMSALAGYIDTYSESQSILQVSYEDFLTNPRRELGKILQFCNLSPDEKSLEEMVLRVNGGRCFAFRQDEELKRFYSSVKNRPLMKRFGYGDIGS